MGAYSNSTYSADFEDEETPRSLKALRTEYIYALPKSVMGAAVASPPVPAPVRMNGTVVGHYDGDSIYVKIRVGVGGLSVDRQLFRILGIACLELRDPGGRETRDALKIRPGMTVGSPVVLTAPMPHQVDLQNDKYGGRLDAVVTYLVDGQSRDLAADLIADGWAVPWNGSGTQPKPPWPREVPG